MTQDKQTLVNMLQKNKKALDNHTDLLDQISDELNNIYSLTDQYNIMWTDELTARVKFLEWNHNYLSNVLEELYDEKETLYKVQKIMNFMEQVSCED